MHTIINDSQWDNLPTKHEGTRITNREHIENIETLKKKFWSHVHRWGNNCWLWAGTIHVRHIDNGYSVGRLDGQFSHKGINYVAHRMAYLLETGDIPEGYDIHHKCKQPLCVRPEHLEAISMEEHRARHIYRRIPPLPREKRYTCAEVILRNLFSIRKELGENAAIAYASKVTRMGRYVHPAVREAMERYTTDEKERDWWWKEGQIDYWSRNLWRDLGPGKETLLLSRQANERQRTTGNIRENRG